MGLPACGSAAPDDDGPDPDEGGASRGAEGLSPDGGPGDGWSAVDASAPLEEGLLADASAEGGRMPIALTGCPSSGYAAPFTIGSQAFNLIVDTGSGYLGVASSTCGACVGAGVVPLYSPGPSALDESTTLTSVYGVGSWDGELFSDVVTLTGTPLAATISFGAITDETSFFAPSGCNFGAVPFAPQGIAGFGPSALASPRATVFMNALAADGVVPDLFAFELCPIGGQMWIGGFSAEDAALSGPIVYTPMTASNYYSVALDDLQLGGTSLGYGPTDFGMTVVDTGTTSLVLPPAILDSLTSAIVKNANFMAAFAGTSGNWLKVEGTVATCYSSTMSRAELDASLPALTLSMPSESGAALSVKLTATESYLQPSVDVSGGQPTTLYCSGLLANTAGTAHSASTIVGVAAMSAHFVVFDVANLRIGFAPQTHCL
jgi:hypothetical protein